MKIYILLHQLCDSVCIRRCHKVGVVKCYFFICVNVCCSESAENIASLLTKMCLKSEVVDGGANITVEVPPTRHGILGDPCRQVVSADYELCQLKTSCVW